MIYRYHYFRFYFFIGPNHGWELGGKYGIKALPDHIEYMVTESYNWFAFSKIKQNEYLVTLELVGFAQISEILAREEPDDQDEMLSNDEVSTQKRPLKLLSPCRTRWLIFAECLQRVLQQVIYIFDRYKPLVYVYQVIIFLIDINHWFMSIR